MTKKKIISVHLFVLFVSVLMLLYFSDELMNFIYPDYGNVMLWMYTMIVGILILVVIVLVFLMINLRILKKKDLKSHSNDN